jgi:glutamyl-Q tRNA(Asp) synthetase
VRRQSAHYDDYRAALAKLDAMGLIYPSFESRAEIARMVAARETQGPWPCDPDGAPLYPGDAKMLSAADRARRVASGAPYALRLDMAAALARVNSSFGGASGASEPGIQKHPPNAVLASGSGPSGRPGMTYDLSWTEAGAGPGGVTGPITADPAAWGDVILARKETPTSYHLAVVVDDAAQGITDVVRGRDLFHATSVHRLLQTLLGLPRPAYHHHRLILDADSRKLAKSTAATALRELRAQGAAAAAIRQAVGLD